MQIQLSAPLALMFYVTGIVAATWHFSNGLFGFCVTWGLTRSAKAQERLALSVTVLFFILCAAGLDILSAFVLEKSAFALIGETLAGLL